MAARDAPEIPIAIAQFAPGRDWAKNAERIAEFGATAASRGARMLVAPEYSAYFSTPFDESWSASAQPLDGGFVAGLASTARDNDLVVVAGMHERLGDDGRFANTLVAVGPDGRILTTYRKIHLYDAFGQRESDWIVAGEIDDPPVFELDGLTVGMQTCYDVRFPEVTRRLVDHGAELIVLPSEWVRGPLKEHHWRTLVTARAIENTVYVAAADHAPPIGAGNSMIVDPMGVELVTIGEIEDVAVAWTSRDRIRRVRERNPALALRRFDVVPRAEAPAFRE